MVKGGLQTDFESAALARAGNATWNLRQDVDRPDRRACGASCAPPTRRGAETGAAPEGLLPRQLLVPDSS